MKSRSFRAALLLLGTFGALAQGACNRPSGEEPAGDQGAPMAPPGEPAQRGEAPQRSQQSPQATQPSGRAQIGSDADIAMVIDVAHRGVIEQGRLAQSKATNAGVREFAQMMVEQHGQSMETGDALFARLELHPNDNALAQQVQTTAKHIMQDLQNAPREAFDRIYITAQVKEHEDLLRLVEGPLRPNAQQGELRSHLGTVHQLLEHHLRMARDLQQRVAGL